MCLETGNSLDQRQMSLLVTERAVDCLQQSITVTFNGREKETGLSKNDRLQ